MGHKKPPRANRLGVWVKREKDAEPRLAADYFSNWFAEFNDAPKVLENDWKIRKTIENKLGRKAGISKVKIVRRDDKVDVNIHSIRPANILGKDNQRVDDLKTAIQAFTPNTIIRIN